MRERAGEHRVGKRRERLLRLGLGRPCEEERPVGKLPRNGGRELLVEAESERPVNTAVRSAPSVMATGASSDMSTAAVASLTFGCRTASSSRSGSDQAKTTSARTRMASSARRNAPRRRSVMPGPAAWSSTTS